MDSLGIPECERIAGSEIRGTDRRTADQATPSEPSFFITPKKFYGMSFICLSVSEGIGESDPADAQHAGKFRPYISNKQRPK